MMDLMDVEAVPAGWQTNPLIFSSSPGTLVSLACSKVALICWSHEIRDLYPDEASNLNRYKYWFIEHKFSCVDVFKTLIPSSIVLKTDNCIKILGVALRNWIDHLFENFSHGVISRCINHVVVESNGIISYKKTARSLLDRDEMTSFEKYLIACKYCFESDIQRLWPSVSDDPVYSQDLRRTRGTHSLINHWTCRMVNEPCEEDPRYELMHWCKFGAWTMIEYFWNRLDRQQQEFVSLSILTTSGAIKYLLPILSTDQLATVLKRIPNKILRNLTDTEESYHHAIQVWDFMLLNDIITNEIFLDILVDLCKITKDYDEYNASRTAEITYFTHATRRKLLHLIWITAPDDLKAFILNQHVLTLFHQLLILNSSILFKAYGFNVDFFLELLINSEFQLRRKLWSQYGRKFIIFAAASDLKIIVELCLPKENYDLIQFKKRMVDYNTLKLEFDLFVINGRFPELGNYLKIFCSSELEEKRVRRQIVDASIHRMFEFDFETWKKFDDFIDSAFSSASSANQQKEEYFRNNLNRIYTLLNDGFLNNMMNIANFLLSHNQEYLAEINSIFLDRFRSNLMSGTCGFILNFNSRKCQEFIKLCTRTDDDFVKFKNNLPVDRIFEAWFITCSSIATYSHLSKFLRWYLEDEEAVKKFLLEKIANYEQVDEIRYILKKGKSSIVYRTLRWFFNEDDEQVKEFCKRSELKMADISCHFK